MRTVNLDLPFAALRERCWGWLCPRAACPRDARPTSNARRADLLRVWCFL